VQVIPAIEVNDLSFKYNEHVVLEKINFFINEGEYVGIVGPNGSGKSTLIKIILGLLPPSTGSVKIFGEDINSFRDKSSIGYVPQRVSFFDGHFPATVREVVESGRTARVGMFRNFSKKDHEAVDAAMEIARIGDLKNKLVGDLSGGQRQRTFIARALASHPKILVLDEPVVGVDIPTQEEFYDFIETLNKKHGLTILFISHDVDIIAHEVETVLCVNRTLVCHTSPHEFIQGDYLAKLYGPKVKFINHGKGRAE
jgi:zinc transport system ATP-binding protein